TIAGVERNGPCPGRRGRRARRPLAGEPGPAGAAARAPAPAGKRPLERQRAPCCPFARGAHPCERERRRKPMNTKETGMILAAWLLAARSAMAQVAEDLNKKQPNARQADMTEMYEDVEILRRLLGARLEAVYGSARQQPAPARIQDCTACHSIASK